MVGALTVLQKVPITIHIIIRSVYYSVVILLQVVFSNANAVFPYYKQHFLRDFPELCRQMQRPTDCMKSSGKREKKDKDALVEIEEIVDEKQTDISGEDQPK